MEDPIGFCRICWIDFVRITLLKTETKAQFEDIDGYSFRQIVVDLLYRSV